MNIPAALDIAKQRERELMVAGWNRTPFEDVGYRIVESAALYWHLFSEAHPQQAQEFLAGVEVALELRSKLDRTKPI